MLNLAILVLAALGPASAQQVHGGATELHYTFATSGDTASIDDLDGDQVRDIVLAWHDDYVEAYSGVDGSLIHHIATPSWVDRGFGERVLAAGLVDGDNIPDILVSAPDANRGWIPDVGAVFIYSGATGALIRRVRGTYDNSHLGEYVAALGDVNGDGHDDFAATSPSFGSWRGALFVFSGADASVLFRVVGPLDHHYRDITPASDLNGDGTPDFLWGGYAPGGGGSSISAFSGVDGSLLYVIQAENDGEYYGMNRGMMWDHDGDGVEDILVGGVLQDDALRIYSGATGLPLDRIPDLHSEWHYTGLFNTAGDFDGDGHRDILLGETRPYPQPDVTTVISGSTLKRIYSTDYRGWSYSTPEFVDDIDGRGRDAILVYDKPWITPRMYVESYRPGLSASTDQISASAGAQVHLTLDFPSFVGDKEYRVLFSTWVPMQGYIEHGTRIPLGESLLLRDCIAGNYPFPTHLGMQGVLDSMGGATASFTSPAGLPANMIGRTLYAAAVVNNPGELPRESSVYVRFTVVP